MHLHILGICGTFMGGLAAIARTAGHTVTGCDANVYPPMSTQLAASGIELTEGYAVAQLDNVARQADVFVIGGYTLASQPVTVWPAARAISARPPMKVPQMPRMCRCMICAQVVGASLSASARS